MSTGSTSSSQQLMCLTDWAQNGQNISLGSEEVIVSNCPQRIISHTVDM